MAWWDGDRHFSYWWGRPAGTVDEAYAWLASSFSLTDKWSFIRPGQHWALRLKQEI